MTPITLPGNLRHPVAGGLLDGAEGAPVLWTPPVRSAHAIAGDVHGIVLDTVTDRGHARVWWAERRWKYEPSGTDLSTPDLLSLDLRRPLGPVVALRWLARADVGFLLAADAFARGGGETVLTRAVLGMTEEADLLAIRRMCLAAGSAS